jgi:hypothetical protein
MFTRVDLQVWRSEERILNKQSRKADNVLSSKFGLGEWLKFLTAKYQIVKKYHTGPRSEKVLLTLEPKTKLLFTSSKQDWL